VVIGDNFTISFELKEYQGGSKLFEYIDVIIKDGVGSELYSAKKWYNVGFSQFQDKSFSTTTYLDLNEGEHLGFTRY